MVQIKIKNFPTLKSVHRETIDLDCSFINIAEKFANDMGTTLLLSGGNLDCSKYHILGIKPWLSLTGTNNDLKLSIKNKSYGINGNPFDIVGEILNHFTLLNHGKLNDSLNNLYSSFPIISGLFGYFSYDLKNNIEKLPQTCIGNNLPDICLYAPSAILIRDKNTKNTDLFIPCFENSSVTHISKIQNFFHKKIGQDPSSAVKNSNHNQNDISQSNLKSSFSKKEYIAKVKQVIKYLKEGDIYQANLSQRFETEFKGNAFNLFTKLYKKNPASFFAFINAGNHQILSTSPERFIKREYNKIETRPIKGTIARGTTKKQDTDNANILKNSKKDDAELTMIVDLMRNDLSKVSDPGSIIVKNHKKLEPYDNVFHLVSIVKGTLLQDKTSIDFLKACFPGGSITGCPKIRSMQIIDELEPVQRHVYTGSIGYLSFHDTMDLSIAIRTATVFDEKLCFSVGGGIVFDSDPEKEYQETLDKGKTIMDALDYDPPKKNSLNIIGNKSEKAWVNGKIIDKNKACIPIDCPGFQYGAGLFETLRAENGKILRLEEHLKRLNKGLKQLFNKNPVKINFKDVIKTLLKTNNLNTKTAAVKIIAAENNKNCEFPFFFAVFAKEYIHRLYLNKKQGIELIQYPFPRYSHVSDHKSLNYLYYYLAGIFARQNNLDEALILNPDMTISETNTCNIVIIKDNKVIVPKSEHVLKGVTLNAVINLLKQKKFEIEYRKIFYKELYSFSNIFLTNALMGAVPVISIRGNGDHENFKNYQIKYSKKILEMINTNIINYNLF